MSCLFLRLRFLFLEYRKDSGNLRLVLKFFCLDGLWTPLICIRFYPLLPMKCLVAILVNLFENLKGARPWITDFRRTATKFMAENENTRQIFNSSWLLLSAGEIQHYYNIDALAEREEVLLCLSKSRRVQELIRFLTHIIGGAPDRGFEIAIYIIRNTEKCTRKVCLSQGLVVLLG